MKSVVWLALTLTAFLTVSMGLSGCHSEPILAEWHDRDGDVNGKLDFSVFKGMRLNDVNARFVIANDNEQLVLAVQTSDEMLQRQIEIGGVTVWITNPQDRNDSFGVHYPARPGRPERMEKPIEFMEPTQGRPDGLVELLDRRKPGQLLTRDEAKFGGILTETIYESTVATNSLVIDFADCAPWLSVGQEFVLELSVPELERPDGMRESEKRGPLPNGGDFGPMGGGMPGGQHGGPPQNKKPELAAGKSIHVTQVVVLAK